VRPRLGRDLHGVHEDRQDHRARGPHLFGHRDRLDPPRSGPRRSRGLRRRRARCCPRGRRPHRSAAGRAPARAARGSSSAPPRSTCHQAHSLLIAVVVIGPIGQIGEPDPADSERARCRIGLGLQTSRSVWGPRGVVRRRPQ